MRDLRVVVLLPGFQARCVLQVYGMVQMFINDDQKAVFPLRDVTLHGLEAGNPAVSMRMEEMFVVKAHCHALAFDTMLSQEDTGLMARIERLVVYTSHYAIEGDFHMGKDMLVSDFIASSRSQFIGATNVNMFPLFQPQAAVVQQAPLVFIHRAVVQMHHLIG
ncbi:MAG TPA: hypothetical protein VMT24_14555 [Aggregatilineaceae bacterium]|nr:hypothetical protein [Aggregatilineaceae bacterium]